MSPNAKKTLEQGISKVMPHLAIIEGNHEGLVEKKDNGAVHGAAEGFANVLSSLDAELTFRIIRPHFADFAPHSEILEGCDGVVFTGSAVSWSADEAPAAPARDVMALALRQGLPVFGSCYGMQLAVAVLGGRNRAHHQATEFAIAYDISLTEAGRTHALFQDKPAMFDARCMHRDEVADLPQGALCLATNAHSQVQAMSYETASERVWAVQYHPELFFADIGRYIAKNDVTSFSDCAAFAAHLSLEKTVDDIISDFAKIDTDEGLQQAYQLSSSHRTAIHQTELVNFLTSLG